MNGAVFVACRVQDLPTPYVPSVLRPCERCSEPVWIDPASFTIATARQGAEPLVLCDVCAEQIHR